MEREAEEVIKKNRESLEKLKQMHLDYIQSNGKDGCACLNYEEFMNTYYNMTDEQILNTVEERGIKIIDKEEYLEKIKKEKTN